MASTNNESKEPTSKLSMDAPPFTLSSTPNKNQNTKFSTPQKSPGKSNGKGRHRNSQGGKSLDQASTPDIQKNEEAKPISTPDLKKIEEAKAIGEAKRKEREANDLKRRAETESLKKSNIKLVANIQAERAKKESIKAELDHKKKAVAAFVSPSSLEYPDQSIGNKTSDDRTSILQNERTENLSGHKNRSPYSSPYKSNGKDHSTKRDSVSIQNNPKEKQGSRGEGSGGGGRRGKGGKSSDGVKGQNIRRGNNETKQDNQQEDKEKNQKLDKHPMNTKRSTRKNHRGSKGHGKGRQSNDIKENSNKKVDVSILNNETQITTEKEGAAEQQFEVENTSSEDTIKIQPSMDKEEVVVTLDSELNQVEDHLEKQVLPSPTSDKAKQPRKTYKAVPLGEAKALSDARKQKQIEMATLRAQKIKLSQQTCVEEDPPKPRIEVNDQSLEAVEQSIEQVEVEITPTFQDQTETSLEKEEMQVLPPKQQEEVEKEVVSKLVSPPSSSTSSLNGKKNERKSISSSPRDKRTSSVMNFKAYEGLMESKLLFLLKSNNFAKYLDNMIEHKITYENFLLMENNNDFNQIGIAQKDHHRIRALIIRTISKNNHISKNNDKNEKIDKPNDMKRGSDVSSISSINSPGGSVEDAKKVGAERRKQAKEAEAAEKRRQRDALNAKHEKDKLKRSDKSPSSSLSSSLLSSSQLGHKVHSDVHTLHEHNQQTPKDDITTMVSEQHQQNSRISSEPKNDMATDQKFLENLIVTAWTHVKEVRSFQECSDEEKKRRIASITSQSKDSTEKDNGEVIKKKEEEEETVTKLEKQKKEEKKDKKTIDIEYDLDCLKFVFEEAKRSCKKYPNHVIWCSEEKNLQLKELKQIYIDIEREFKIKEAKKLGQEKRAKEIAIEIEKQKKKEEIREKMKCERQEQEKAAIELELVKKQKADEEAKAKGEAKRLALAEEEAKKRKAASDAVKSRQASLVEKTLSQSSHVESMNSTQPPRGIEGAFAARGRGGGIQNDDGPKSRHGVTLSGIEGFRTKEENRKAREDLANKLDKSNPYANPTNPHHIARTFPSLADAHNTEWQPPPPPPPVVEYRKDSEGQTFKDMSRPNRIIGHSLGRDINSHVKNVSKAQNAAVNAIKSSYPSKQSSPYSNQKKDRTGFDDDFSSKQQVPAAAMGTVWAQKEKLTKVCDGASSIMAPLRLAPKTNMVNLSNNNNQHSSNNNRTHQQHSPSFSHKSKQTSSQLRLSSFPPSSSPSKLEKKSVVSSSSSSSSTQVNANNNINNNETPSRSENKDNLTISNVMSPSPTQLETVVTPPVGWGKKAAKWGDYSDSDSD